VAFGSANLPLIEQKKPKKLGVFSEDVFGAFAGGPPALSIEAGVGAGGAD